MLRSAISAFTRVFDTLWRCAADPGSIKRWVPALRSGVSHAAPRPGQGFGYLGKPVDPIRKVSMARAHSRPSRIAQTTSDCPRRMSPAENTFDSDVW